MARSCIFCGGTPVTQAHAFRKAWLESILPSQEPFVHRHERTGPGAFDRSWSLDEFGIAPHCVCQTCNGGWMDGLDRAGEPLIEGCVAGTPRVFGNLVELETLATWLMLVSMIFDHTQASPVIPPSHHSLFYRNRKPLNGSAMWLAGTSVSSTQYELNAWSRTVRMGSSTDTGHGYFLTVRIQNFVTQVWIPTDWKTDLTFETVNTEFMNQFWPTPATPVSWPPPKRLREADLTTFADRFITN